MMTRESIQSEAGTNGRARSRSLRRRLWLVAIFLMAGIGLNALVSAACLCYSPAGWIAVGTGGDDGVGVPSNTMVRKPPAHTRSFGVHCIGVEHFWVLPRRTPDERHPPLFAYQVDSIAIGWPLPAFVSTDVDSSGVSSFAEFKAMAAAAGDRPTTRDLGLRRIGAAHRLIPTRIAPIGLIANTLFYALLTVAAALAFRAIRRRLRTRAGKCAQCAYPLTGGPVCPECGEAAPPPRPDTSDGARSALAVSKPSTKVSVS